MSCIFCEETKVIVFNKLAYARYDNYPVTKYHALIIPKRHIDSYFDLKDEEVIAIHSLVKSVTNKLKNKDKTITGFNVGFNNGKSAGQSVFHTHVHVIPRRDGDMKNPLGGVRHVIPEKGNYEKNTCG